MQIPIQEEMQIPIKANHICTIFLVDKYRPLVHVSSLTEFAKDFRYLVLSLSS